MQTHVMRGKLKIRINFQFERIVRNPIFTVSGLSDDGIVIFESYSDNEIDYLNGNGIIEFSIESFTIKPGLYHISVTLSEKELLNKLEWHNNLYSIKVLNNEKIRINQGLTYLNPNWKVNFDKIEWL